MGWLTDILKDIPLNAVLREKITEADRQIEQLQQENQSLKTANEELRQKHEAQLAQAKYTEHEGAIFKIKRSGGYHRAVYCPNCHASTAPFPPGAEFNCMKCGWYSGFTEKDLPRILSELASL